MRRVLGALLLCLLVSTSLLLPACQNGGTQEGQLPTYQVGDRWVWSYAMEGGPRTLTEEIVDAETVEGRDCHVINMEFDPVMSWTQGDMECAITSMTYWGDKATETYSYSPWTSLFPLEIGKEVEMEKTTTQYSDGEQTGDALTGTEAYEMDSKEDVTVAAGTFSCWEITMYDDAGDVIQTMWWSDEVKSMVKSTDADGNTLMELQSYSVE